MIDLINSCFEFGAAFALMLHIRRLIIDRQTTGVAITPWFFFAAWGLWNLHYYPSVGHPMSFYAGIVVFLCNVVWITLALYFKHHKGQAI